MRDKIFLDTNIIIYTFFKDEKALKAIELLKDENSIISYQVIQEFCNVVLKKFKFNFTLEECKEYINNILLPMCLVYPNKELYNITLDIKSETNYSFYDCLILAAAYISNCKIIYSEDMHSNHEIRNMRIVNPFTVR
jgi:predicted nucleic acid-binding protein